MVSDTHISDSHAAWEVYPSTRSSLQPHTKYFPIDTTLSVAGTAQDLYNVSSANIPVVNIATNPSFETGDPPTGYTASGSTISQSNTVARNGTFSMLIDPDDAAAGEGAYWVTPALSGGGGSNSTLYLVASAYFNDNAGSGDDARIAIRSATNVLQTAGNTVTLAASWGRSSASFPLTTTGTPYRVFFETVSQHNTNFYVDSFQIEIRRSSNVTDYCDGSIGLNNEWLGTAHATASRRRRGIYVIRGFDLHFTGDTYISFDHVATSSTGVFVRAGTDWSPDFPLMLMKRLSFLNVNPGETPRVWGTVWGVPFGENPTG